MKKIELEIVALSHSITQTHSYAVVLGEINGLRRLPIVIGGFEAQAIAVALEKMHPSRPLTHDLMKNFMNAFNIDMQEIVICDLQEGIFYSKLVCISEKDTVEIDSRTSDALALAVRFGCPIYTYEHILESAGILMEDTSTKKKKAGATVKDLYWTLGQFDVMTVVDAPDDARLTALLLSAGALGNLHTQSLRAFSADEMSKIVGKMV